MCRAVSRQIEAPLAVEVHSPDDGEEGLEVREPSMSYGAIYKLHTVYGVFFMNFKEPDLPDRFRVDADIMDMESHFSPQWFCLNPVWWVGNRLNPAKLEYYSIL